MEAENLFQNLKQKVIDEEQGVHDGKMMSAPAIKFNGKVFAFFSKDQRMVFKLGKDASLTYKDVELEAFNPFKNKGPLSGWFELDYEHNHYWEELTYKSLNIIRS